MSDATAHVLVVGDVAKMLKVSPEDVDTIVGSEARVTRTVLRSEVLRILTTAPLDVMITAADASFLTSDEFLAAFATRTQSVSLLMLTRTVDATTRERLRSVAVEVEQVSPPIAFPALRERLTETLRRRTQMSEHPNLAALVRDPITQPLPTSDEILPPPTSRHPPAEAPAPAPAPPESPPSNSPAETTSPAPSAPSAPTALTASSTSPTKTTNSEEDMANINKTLEEAMKIDGAIGAAIADWDSGMCLGTAGGGARLNIEVAAAGNCQVVKAKMATMNELGIKGSIQDILITLDDQIHLIRPLRHGENLFMYLAIDKAKGNLAMARHRLAKIEAELTV